MDRWLSGLKHRSWIPEHMLWSRAVGSNPTRSANRYGATDGMDFDADIELVKSQLAFHETQAEKFANEPRRADRHHATASRFRVLLSDLEAVQALLVAHPDIDQPRTVPPRLSLSWEEIEDLPPEILSELSISDSDRSEFLIQGAIRELGGVASLDRLIVYLFKSIGESYKRTALNQRLYRMSQKDMVFSVPGKKGVYSLREMSEEEASKLT